MSHPGCIPLREVCCGSEGSKNPCGIYFSLADAVRMHRQLRCCQLLRYAQPRPYRERTLDYYVAHKRGKAEATAARAGPFLTRDTPASFFASCPPPAVRHYLVPPTQASKTKKNVRRKVGCVVSTTPFIQCRRTAVHGLI